MKTYDLNNNIKHDVRVLWAALNNAGFETRIVGGWVRDTLMHCTPKDVDFCTTATPDQMIAFAEANNYRVEPTGLQHGTVSFIVAGDAYEFTTLRVDTDTDGRHAEVTFTTDFEVDAARRDFTCNAMSMDINETIYDYFNGKEDLDNNVVRFVGNAQDRISEDFLRILRYFRFTARLDADFNINTLEDIRTMASGLKQISRERIWMEMSKLFVSPGRVAVLEVMQWAGVAAIIGLPDMLATELRHADCAEGAVAQFFAGDGDACRKFCNEWRMSAAETNKAVFITKQIYKMLTQEHVEDMLVNQHPRDWVVSAVVSAHAPTLKAFAETFVIPVMPVKGQDLVDAGAQPGRAMGERLARMRAVWFQSRFVSTHDNLMAVE